MFLALRSEISSHDLHSPHKVIEFWLHISSADTFSATGLDYKILELLMNTDIGREVSVKQMNQESILD